MSRCRESNTRRAQTTCDFSVNIHRNALTPVIAIPTFQLEDAMIVEFQTKQMEFPTERFGYLRESNDALDDIEELRKRFHTDGYLFIRSLIDPDAVLGARAKILEYMAEREALVPGEPVLEGVMPKDGKTVSLLGNRAITHTPEVLRVLQAPELGDFFRELYGEEPVTFSYKWLRAVGNERFTGSHYDVVYMGRGSERVNTVWIPFGETPIDHGTLVICEGSHRLDGFAKLRETYGKTDVDRHNTQGWFSEDPEEILSDFGGRWLTAGMRPGDILTFGLYTMHGSTTNTTNRYRLSCDVRYQPASEPMDERWCGESPKGHYAWQKEPVVPIAESRRQWGV